MSKLIERNKIVRIAAKLYNDGLTPSNHTTDKANAILSNTVNPVYCKKVLAAYEDEIKEKIADFTANNTQGA